MLFQSRDPKLQADAPPEPRDAPSDAVISPDTRRDNRIPPRQARTKKWPVLDAGGLDRAIPLTDWRLSLFGLVETPVDFTWEAFQKLPRTRIFADMHCTVNGEVTVRVAERG